MMTVQVNTKDVLHTEKVYLEPENQETGVRMCFIVATQY